MLRQKQRKEPMFMRVVTMLRQKHPPGVPPALLTVIVLLIVLLIGPFQFPFPHLSVPPVPIVAVILIVIRVGLFQPPSSRPRVVLM